MKKVKKNKRTGKKSTKSKRTRTESSPISATGDQDILGLLSTLVKKLTSFEAKIDLVLNQVASKIPAQPPILPRQPSMENLREHRRDSRPMYKATCAECRTFCQVPFRPTGDRPVYCKECYRARKSNGIFKARTDDKPKEIEPVYTQAPEKPKPGKGLKSVKKKPALKKRKKKR